MARLALPGLWVEFAVNRVNLYNPEIEYQRARKSNRVQDWKALPLQHAPSEAGPGQRLGDTLEQP